MKLAERMETMENQELETRQTITQLKEKVSFLREVIAKSGGNIGQNVLEVEDDNLLRNEPSVKIQEEVFIGDDDRVEQSSELNLITCSEYDDIRPKPSFASVIKKL